MSKYIRIVPWIALLCAMAAVMWANNGYVTTISMTIVIWTILGVSLNVILGLCGYYHMGIGAFYGLGGYGAVVLGTKFGWPILASLVGMPLLAGALSALIAPIVLRVRGLHFAVATMAIAIIASDVTNNWVSLTGGPIGMGGLKRPAPFALGPISVDLQSAVGMFGLGCVVLLLTLIGFAWLQRTNFALVLRGIKSDELQTKAFGYATSQYKIAAFSLSSAMAALAGVLYAYFIQYVSPEPFTFAASSFQVFVIVAVGGPGRLWGPLLGAILLTALPETLELQPQVKLIIYGAVLFVVMVFLPAGLASIFRPFSAQGMLSGRGGLLGCLTAKRAAGNVSD